MGLKCVCASLFICVAVVTSSPALAADTASAILKDKDGKEIGQVALTRTQDGVLINVTLTSVAPGEHAFHIHAVGKCEAPDFKSAGPHFNPDQTKHGVMNPEGPHSGDMPNLHVPDSGKLQVEILNTLVSLDEDAALLDEDGSALIVHAGADDYKTDPAGNAGDRIACGVVTK
jgi:Cu-Zn family superoxide dismutase